MINLMNISKEFKNVALPEMSHAGYKAQIMEAERLVGKGVFSLPKGEVMPIIPIECLPGCPSSWVRECGTYVIPVEVNKGIWFSWIMNDINTAIVLSVKGMNPVTGKKIESLNLEQYRDKCPEHNINLGHNGYCEECGFEVPYQNYISYPNRLWWDGFRQPDGTVRQFFFTEDDERDIASLVIGKQNTVPAFGFGFFRTKQDRVVKNNNVRRPWFNIKSDDDDNVYTVSTSSCCIGNNYDCFLSEPEPPVNHVYYSSKIKDNTGFSKGITSKIMNFLNSDDNVSLKQQRSIMKSAGVKISASLNTPNIASAGIPLNNNDSVELQSMQICNKKVIKTKNIVNDQIKDVSVGAGALINQKLNIDMTPLSEYLVEPQGIIRLYFVFENQLKEIVKNGGIKPHEKNNTGYLKDLPVG